MKHHQLTERYSRQGGYEHTFEGRGPRAKIIAKAQQYLYVRGLCRVMFKLHSSDHS